MKKYFVALIFVLPGNFVLGDTGIPLRPENVFSDPGISTDGNGWRNLATIDNQDTVVFDLSHAIVSGNQFEIPVSVLSNDVIYALDFSLKYNQTALLYDTIHNQTNYMHGSSFYNSTDSTIRCTSYSLQNYTMDTTLVTISFTMMASPISISDFASVRAYLNGFPCSVKLINFIITDAPDPDVEHGDDVDVYPNPAHEVLYVSTGFKSTIQLSDMSGRKLYFETKTTEKQNLEINIQNLASGIYLLKIFNNDVVSIRKVVIQTR
jgi:hypothetical protein